ncbi:MAG: hypothetical protein J5797_02325 [Prevotella sp.]|nr:hypothetical protein [Prevotella sp.]
MEEKYHFLKNPFDKLSKGDENEFQKKCAKIAKELFGSYCINCNDKEYYFAEIEFYYYEKDRWRDKWNEVTYARKNYKAGDLFYHLSGIDICFDSHYDTKTAKFGGVLIRAIRDEEGKVIAGPLTCKDEILNACKCGKMPRLSRASKTLNIDVKSTYRALGEKDIDKENDRLCLYDSRINDWNPPKNRYNTRKGEIESRKGTYKTDRFNDNH